MDVLSATQVRWSIILLSRSVLITAFKQEIKYLMAIATLLRTVILPGGCMMVVT
jgi:hypothetical protein